MKRIHARFYELVSYDYNIITSINDLTPIDQELLLSTRSAGARVDSSLSQTYRWTINFKCTHVINLML